MAIYTKTSIVTIDDDDNSQRISFYRAQKTDGTWINVVDVQIGSTRIQTTLAALFSVVDRSALGPILRRGIVAALLADGATTP